MIGSAGTDTEDSRSAASGNYEPHDRKGFRFRIWIAGILFVSLVVLYAIERYSSVIKPDLDELEQSRALESAESMESEIFLLLEGYGIKDKWIRKTNVSLPDHEDVRNKWIIMVPMNIPLASINFDLKELVTSWQGRAFAVENAKTTQVTIHLQFRDFISYSLMFVPSRRIIRDGGKIALIVDGIEDAPESEIETLLVSNDPVSISLIPNLHMTALYERLTTAGKEVILHFHFFRDDTEESRFRLSEDLRELDLRNRLRKITKIFRKSKNYYLTSERALGSNSQITAEELSGLGCRKIDASRMSYIDRSSEFEDMSARMNDIAATAAREGDAIGVMELQSGSMGFLNAEIIRLRKKGLDFVRVSEIVPPADMR